MNQLNMKTSFDLSIGHRNPAIFYYYNLRKHKQCNWFAIVSYNRIIYDYTNCFVRYCFMYTIRYCMAQQFSVHLYEVE